MSPLSLVVEVKTNHFDFGLITLLLRKYGFKVIISQISLGSSNFMLISSFDHWKYSDISIGNGATVILGTFNNNKQCDAGRIFIFTDNDWIFNRN